MNNFFIFLQNFSEFITLKILRVNIKRYHGGLIEIYHQLFQFLLIVVNNFPQTIPIIRIEANK